MSKIRDGLLELQDKEYLDFNSKLIPNIDKDTMVGIRMPALRKFEKMFRNTQESREFIKQLPHTYFEENNLHGLIINEMKDYEECIANLELFLPYVDNWATCDLLAPKAFKKNKDRLIQCHASNYSSHLRQIYRRINSISPSYRLS